MYVLSSNFAFEIACEDLKENLEWLESKRACAQLGDRWRLPSKEELQQMLILHQKGIGNFELVNYWSSDGVNNFQAFNINFSNGQTNENFSSKKPPKKYRVRPVRSI